jgi:hypothetical protein
MSFFQNTLFRKLLESKLKDVPVAQKEQLLDMIEKNPQLFESIAKEIQEAIATGKDQMTSTMEVMGKHKDELQELANK